MKKTILFLVMAVALTTSTLFAQVPSYVPTNGLVGYWPFNGNANDESGNGNNGTVNGASLTTDRFGYLNQHIVLMV
jgi:opacity protein-like surface antigen